MCKNNYNFTKVVDDIRRRIANVEAFSKYCLYLDERLVFSTSRSIGNNPPHGWWSSQPDTIQVAAFFSEQWSDYRIVLFKVIGPDTADKLTVEIHEIANLFNFSEKPDVVCLLCLNDEQPMLVRYTLPSMSIDNIGTVELDLKSVVGGYPRLVERIIDMIVFLGEVLAAGSENQ